METVRSRSRKNIRYTTRATVNTPTRIPVNSIFPKFSTVVYQSYTNGWHPEEFHNGIRGYDKLDFKSYDLNEQENLLVAVMAKEQNIEGIKVKEVRTLTWSYLVMFYDDKKNLLYINSLDNGSLYHSENFSYLCTPNQKPNYKL